ncbi:hypothetical protein HMPREF1494_1190 [Bifidobacterium sp. MSTE12]|nr:hypothetical protein HMPREF1494_1190 [Bifidobacterium sp. MSTE12]
MRAVASFQSTLSVRRATNGANCCTMPTIISIHALREESDLNVHSGDVPGDISIHALREESDLPAGKALTVLLDFNPRSP